MLLQRFAARGGEIRFGEFLGGLVQRPVPLLENLAEGTLHLLRLGGLRCAQADDAENTEHSGETTQNHVW